MNRFQPGQAIVDLVNRLTNKRGAVGNLYGNVLEAEFGAKNLVAGAGWYYVQGLGSTPREVLIDASLNSRAVAFSSSIEGFTAFSDTDKLEAGNGVLIYTGVTPTTPNSSTGTLAPLAISAPDASIAVYLNDVLVQRGYCSITVDLLLEPKKNVIQIVLQDTILTDVIVSVESSLPIGQLPNAPSVPTWDIASVIYGFFGTQESSGGVRLGWNDSSFAGSWKIERTSYRLLNAVNSFTTSTVSGTYTFSISGSYDQLSGTVLVDTATVLGDIVATSVVNPVTQIVVRSDVAAGSWSGKNLYVSNAQAVIVNIQRKDAIVPNDGVFHYLDTSINEALPYSYRLAAVHPLHASLESSWSIRKSIFALDNTPPGSVTVTDTKQKSGEVYVNYRTPDDIDYLGVRVYQQLGSVYTPVLSDFGRPQQNDQLSFFPTGSGTYWLRSFDWARNVQPEGSGVILDFWGLNELSNFRIIRRTALSVTFGWIREAGVDEVRVYTPTYAEPIPDDPWPDDNMNPAEVLVSGASLDEYTVARPTPGYLTYVQFEPRDPSLNAGPVERVIVGPPGMHPDRILALSVLIDDDDGSAQVTAYFDEAQSWRYAYIVADDPAWPDPSVVESAGFRTVSGGADTFSLPPGTVGYNQKIRLRGAAYLAADGTGTGGVTDHGDIRNAEDIRLKPPVTLEATTATKTSTTATHTVIVHDIGGYATNLYYRTIEGGAAPGDWFLKTDTPADTAPYSQTVTLLEKHQVFVEWQLEYSLHGALGHYNILSPGFDQGRIPDIVIAPHSDEDAGAVSASVLGDFDTVGSRLKAYKVASYPGDSSAATAVRATSLITGRILSSTTVGSLITGLVPGDKVRVVGFGYGPNGEESSAMSKVDIVFGTTAPILRAGTTSESGSTGTFAVVVDDPGGQADLLEYQKRDAGTSWPSSWDVQSSAPSHLTQYSQTCALSKGHPAQIRFRLRFTLNGQTQYTAPVSSPVFDIGKIADVTDCQISFDYLGDVIVTAGGDYDTANIYITINVGSAPSDPTSSSTGHITGRNGIYVSSTTCAVGLEAWVKVAAYNNETSPVRGPVRTFRRLREGSGSDPESIAVVRSAFAVGGSSGTTDGPPTDATNLVSYACTGPSGAYVTIITYAAKDGDTTLGEFNYDSPWAETLALGMTYTDYPVHLGGWKHGTNAYWHFQHRIVIYNESDVLIASAFANQVDRLLNIPI